MPSTAVGGSPSATDGENFAVCLLRLCRVLGAHGELANSGSNSSRLCYIIVMFSKQKYIILGTKQRDRFMFEEK